MKNTNPVYVILVALEPNNFEHYITEPHVFYDTHQEADTVMKQFINTKEYKSQQLKIQKLWMIQKNPY